MKTKDDRATRPEEKPHPKDDLTTLPMPELQTGPGCRQESGPAELLVGLYPSAKGRLIAYYASR